MAAKDRPAKVPGGIDDLDEVALDDVVLWQDAPVVVVFWVLFVVVFLQVFTRYVLNHSIGWTEEIARYLLIAVTFLGSVLAMRKRSHVAVNFFYRYLGASARRGLVLGVDALVFAFTLWAAWICADLARRTNQLMAFIDVSRSVIYWLVAACLLLMALFAASHFIRHLRRPETIDGDLLSGQVMD